MGIVVVGCSVWMLFWCVCVYVSVCVREREGKGERILRSEMVGWMGRREV